MDFDSILGPFQNENGQFLIRWVHVLAGVIWIGLLYFFNWVNSGFAPTMDGETKQKVVPELMPRALFWFRWGAAWTWISGFALLFMMYYHGAYLGDGLASEAGSWALAFGGLFVGFLVYDILSKKMAGQLWPNLLVWGAIVTAYGWYLETSLGFPARAVIVHCGAMFGTAMAANVWMRIWPAQQRIITAIKEGNAPDGADAAMAGIRSKHNTYMSVPLLLYMLSPDQAVATSVDQAWLFVAFVMLVGFGVCARLYNKAAGVSGF